MNVSTILVEWEEPFTLQDFPIINYMMEVFSQTSDELITSSVLDPDTLSFTHTQTGSSGSLTFSVVAHNSVGASVPGTVEGAFPTCEFNSCNNLRVLSTPVKFINIYRCL